MFIFFVHDAGVVFVFFLFIFLFRFSFGGEEGDLLAVGRPCKMAHAALPCGKGAGFAAIPAHGEDLLLFVTVGEESQLFPVRRPAR